VTSRQSQRELRAELDLVAEPRSLSTARSFVASMLDLWECDDPDQVIALLTSEIVSNAVRHAGGKIGLEMAMVANDELRIEASDTHPDIHVAPRVDRRGEGGRGLLLVESLARRWGVETHERYKVVWFEVPVVPRHRSSN
jgi:anti-sigma regulatory factor (Ser/Thr protein kinase)